jgi:hypothetical protein
MSTEPVSPRDQARARLLAGRLAGMAVGPTGRAHLTGNDAERIATMAIRALLKGE